MGILSDKRLEYRKSIQKECVLSNGFGMVTASTVDISEKGLGVLINGTMQFKQNDEVIAFLDSKASWCQVMWVRALNEASASAGLKYFQD